MNTYRSTIRAAALAAFLFALSPLHSGRADARSDAATMPSEQNLLSNPGFESATNGAPEGWTQGKAVDGVTANLDSSVAHSGKSSLSLQKTTMRYWPPAEWTQTFTNAGTEPYLKVSGWVKADSISKAIIDVQFVNAASVAADRPFASHQWAAYIGSKSPSMPALTHDWKLYTGTVRIPPGTTQIIVAPQIYGPGHVWFDDLTASYTTEPPTSTARPAGGAPAPPASASTAAAGTPSPIAPVPSATDAPTAK